jgi:phenylacetic acid degradation operon negative regulatory protein
VGAAAAQYLRRDPVLPAELLPVRWPGEDLRRAYAAYRRAFGPAVADWLSG